MYIAISAVFLFILFVISARKSLYTRTPLVVTIQPDRVTIKDNDKQFISNTRYIVYSVNNTNRLTQLGTVTGTQLNNGTTLMGQFPSTSTYRIRITDQKNTIITQSNAMPVTTVKKIGESPISMGQGQLSTIAPVAPAPVSQTPVSQTFDKIGGGALTIPAGQTQLVTINPNSAPKPVDNTNLLNVSFEPRFTSITFDITNVSFPQTLKLFMNNTLISTVSQADVSAGKKTFTVKISGIKPNSKYEFSLQRADGTFASSKISKTTPQLSIQNFIVTEISLTSVTLKGSPNFDNILVDTFANSTKLITQTTDALTNGVKLIYQFSPGTSYTFKIIYNSQIIATATRSTPAAPAPPPAPVATVVSLSNFEITNFTPSFVTLKAIPNIDTAQVDIFANAVKLSTVSTGALRNGITLQYQFTSGISYEFRVQLKNIVLARISRTLPVSDPISTIIELDKILWTFINSQYANNALGTTPFASQFFTLHERLKTQIGIEPASLFGFTDKKNLQLGGAGIGGLTNTVPDKVIAAYWMDGYNNIVVSRFQNSIDLKRDTVIKLFPFMAKGDASYNTRFRLDTNLTNLVNSKVITVQEKNNIKTAAGSANVSGCRVVMSRLGVVV